MAYTRPRGARPGLALASALAAALVAPGGASDSSGCRCLTQQEVNAVAGVSEYVRPGGEMFFELNGVSYNLPAGYGVGACSAYDQGLPPKCAVANAPAWCLTAWCYVDPSACDNVHIKSRYFRNSNLHFSYSTCANAEGSSGRPSAGSRAEWSAAQVEGTRQIITLIETYTRSSRDLLQDTFLEVNGSVQCEVEEICPVGSLCPSCSTVGSWGSVDFARVGAHVGPNGSAEEKHTAKCLSAAVADSYSRVAGRELDADFQRVGYQYFADQRTGTYTQWPKDENNALCAADWDPRMRPWYAAGATGPKDVVLLVDVSGSMSQYDRHSLAKGAAKAVLDVLTWKDFATIVLFNSNVYRKYSNTLVPVTESRRAAMKAWIDSASLNWKNGGTNFGEAFNGAFEVIGESIASGETSMCQKAILFMTDGVDTDFDSFSMVQQKATEYDAIVFSYSLGGGADTAKPKRLACENRGIYYKVPEEGDLATIMAKFYEYFVQGQELCSASWVKYSAVGLGTELYAACQPMYNRTSPSAGLLGVTCMDMNLIETVTNMKNEEGWDHFVCQASDITKRCRQLDLNECSRQKMRLAYSSESVCTDQETVTEDTVCSCMDANCQDDASFVDALDYFCDTWVGDTCEYSYAQNKGWSYTEADMVQVRSKCRRSCGLCTPKPPAQCSGSRTSSLECETINVEDTCRACRGRVSGVDIEGNAMSWHCGGTTTTVRPGGGSASDADGGQVAATVGGAAIAAVVAAFAASMDIA